MRLASHPSIIHFYGVTELEDEKNYSLVLEYADGGTLEKYLSDNVKTKIKWEIQLKFAKEIAWAVLWLHDSDIIHGELHPKNILIHQTTLGVVYWELTSCSSPFDFENKFDRNQITLIILGIIDGEREIPIPNTNKCWQHEPQKRPDINEVILELDNIHLIDSENNNESSHSELNESKIIEELENEHSDLASYNYCDINFDKDNESNCLDPEHFDLSSFDYCDIDKYQLPTKIISYAKT
ncbi:kinase-like protein [Rhizophagus irregularis]|uniref:Kinase-like protein n=1 Tax=Rhizophagus irregularis TaxID=588596 RepID=A0A2I1ESS8_9GLOM|nr:kinase-like protein [Rhizophagus irregularis]PKC71114.1 kinase-like protein [Rhizophagus irregularis]PKY25167.1 kinase-like protein [Rhizophagus irregularis]